MGVSPTSDRFGEVDKAYSFNGISDYMLVPDDASLNNENLSLSFWFRTSNTNTQNVIYKTDTATALNEAYSIALNLAEIGRLDCSVKNGNNCANPGVGWQHNNFISNTNSGVWMNHTFTYNGTVSKIYLNGHCVSTQAFSPGSVDLCPGGELLFGMAWNFSGHFQGDLDDIGIWNRALSDVEVLEIYDTNDYAPNNIGINNQEPNRNLHIRNVLHLEPRSIPPSNPSKGDIYFDGITNKLRVFDGTVWQSCWD